MIELLAMGFLFWGFLFMIAGSFFDYFGKKSKEVQEEFDAWRAEKEQEEIEELTEAGDYWNGEDIDYDTGEISADARPGVRHPKNRDRAYSGSVERFHDGGW
jgi:hypothetical protein